MKKTVFLYSGEGTRSSESDCDLLKHSAYWTEIEQILHDQLGLDLETIWNGDDPLRCPTSPLVTTVAQICLADTWKRWGHEPDVVIGHSIGELAAAFQAGFYSLEQILVLAHRIGEVTAKLDGAMAHGPLTEDRITTLPVNLSSLNFADNGKIHVTLSDYEDNIADFMGKNAGFVRMQLPHPWHHPDYEPFVDRIPELPSRKIDGFKFVSGVTGAFENQLDVGYWRRWQVHSVDFIGAVQTIRDRFDGDALEIVEIGFHPVLAKCCEVFSDHTYASSMFRGEDGIKWILFQRKRLDQQAFLAKLNEALKGYNARLDQETPLAYQGLTSLNFMELSAVLQPFFPSLAPQDFYRYKSIKQLIDQFGIDNTAERMARPKFQKNDVVVAGMSCRFPASSQTPAQFWNALLSGQDQVRADLERGSYEAGFLDDVVSRFDHHYFNISDAEAQTMDPQQILALELAELLWQDAGIDPKTLDPRRVGVYLGVWNHEYTGRKESVYYPTGTNPSIIASRISYHYDLRGPSWVSNTACSSSLVAVHYAAKDIEDGRIDFAVAGGVNMLLGNAFTGRMRNAGFLSKDHRCKAFDNSANGYVRAEGGGLVLLTRKDLADRYYAELLGSSINQNGALSQTITAPHPVAQEELILDACDDAGIAPQDIAYVECHGTGTKIGDPIEISALKNTIARDRKDPCHIGSVKSNIGHLESAAGIAGLIKALLVVNHGKIPANLHFDHPNEYIDFKGSKINVVAREVEVNRQINVGISSFGFGGSNAHVIIKGADDGVRKPVQEQTVPFSRDTARRLRDYYLLDDTAQPAAGAIERPAAEVGADVRAAIVGYFRQLTGIEEIIDDVELFEQGLDSMSATELIHNLEQEFSIELDPDIFFEYPLLDQFTEAVENIVVDKGKNPTSDISAPDTAEVGAAVPAAIARNFHQLTGIEEIMGDVELFEQGLDSMSAAELIHNLEQEFSIELDPDILFEYPLLDQFTAAVENLVGANEKGAVTEMKVAV